MKKSNLLKYEYNSNNVKQGDTEKGEEITTINTHPNTSYVKHLSIRSDSERFFMLQGTANAEKN